MILTYLKSSFHIILWPFLYLFYFFSGFSKRNSHIWVFGSFGTYNDNSKYLFEYINNNEPTISAIWISKSLASVTRARLSGYRAYSTWSFLGLYYSLRAKAYIYSAYVSDINFFTSRNALKINLWHGIPLKKIEFDIKSKPLSDIFTDASLWVKYRRPAQHVKPNLLLATSQHVADYSFKSAFRVEENNMIIATYPRVIDLCKRNKLRKNNKNFTFLYAPTWRDSGGDFIIASQINFSVLNEFLSKNNAVLILKFHPATHIDFLPSSYSQIRLADKNDDPNNLMVESDCLITDYSSIYFDYICQNKPVLFFPFEKEEYLSQREMYRSDNKSTPGRKADNINQLINNMELTLSNPKNNKQLREAMIKKYSPINLKSNRHITDRIKALTLRV